jgi:hypothetical protein
VTILTIPAKMIGKVSKGRVYLADLTSRREVVLSELVIAFRVDEIAASAGRPRVDALKTTAGITTKAATLIEMLKLRA